MRYTKNNTIINWNDEIDQMRYEKRLSVLCEWDENVDRLDELIVLLDSFVGNKEFEKYFSHCEYGDEGQFDFDEKLIPIVHGAYSAMNILDYFPYYFPSLTHHLVVANSIASLIAVIQLAFVHYNNRLLTTEEDKIIKVSDIFYYLTFYAEDYDNPDNEYIDYGYDFYKDFFKRAKKTYWVNKKTKKLSDSIRDLRTNINGMCHFGWDVHNIVYMAAIYLMVCNAFKNGRDAVSSEDVVVGYLTIYKMIFNDIRPLVYNLYDEKKWGKINKKITKYKPLDESPFENMKNED